MTTLPPLVPIPTTVNGYPVITAIREQERDQSWVVICRRTERAAHFGDQPLYVVWHVRHADGAYHAENGDYGPHHGLTWVQAQRSLHRRADLSTYGPPPPPAAGSAADGEHTGSRTEGHRPA
ncbi:hypothetical protein ACQEVZ_55490 [Dactylosporangium sp. CA-152071]|uniref:hypothetical protein n=1 Tax=Dactylosporangium sp. CA-152071 TaxID=3239933 RepID=UPI003D8DB916